MCHPDSFFLQLQPLVLKKEGDGQGHDHVFGLRKSILVTYEDVHPICIIEAAWCSRFVS